MGNELENFDMSAFALDPIELGIVDAPDPKEEQEDIEIENKVNLDNSEDSNPERVAVEDTDVKDTNDSEGDSPNPYSSLALALAEEGVLPSFDNTKDKVQSVDDLIEIFKKEIKSNEYKDLTDEQREYLDAIRSGVPPEVYTQGKSALNELSSITQEEIADNEVLRNQLIIQDFVAKGVNQAKAEKLAQRSADIGEDENDALEALESLKEIQKYQFEQSQLKHKADIEKLKQDSDMQIKTLQKTINETKEIIPGMSLTDKVKQRVFEQATKPVAQLQNGQYINAVAKAKMEDPIAFETKLNYLFYVTNGFSDFSKITTSQKSKAVRELDDLVKGNTFIASGAAATKNLDFTPDLDGFDPKFINNIK